MTAVQDEPLYYKVVSYGSSAEYLIGETTTLTEAHDIGATEAREPSCRGYKITDFDGNVIFSFLG